MSVSTADFRGGCLTRAMCWMPMRTYVAAGLRYPGHPSQRGHHYLVLRPRAHQGRPVRASTPLHIGSVRTGPCGQLATRNARRCEFVQSISSPSESCLPARCLSTSLRRRLGPACCIYLTLHPRATSAPCTLQCAPAPGGGDTLTAPCGRGCADTRTRCRAPPGRWSRAPTTWCRLKAARTPDQPGLSGRCQVEKVGPDVPPPGGQLCSSAYIMYYLLFKGREI